MRAQMVQVWNSKFQVIYCWPLPVFMYRMRWLEQSWAEVGATVFEEQTSLSLNDVLKEPKTDLESPLPSQKENQQLFYGQVLPNSISSYSTASTCFAPSVITTATAEEVDEENEEEQAGWVNWLKKFPDWQEQRLIEFRRMGPIHLG